MENVAKAFQTLERKIRQKVLKAAVKAGAQVAKPVIVAAAPSETKTLKKSIGFREKGYQGGAIARAYIGPRKGMKRRVLRTFSKKGKQRIKTRKIQTGDGAGELRDPVFYAHLTEGGRKAFTSKKLMPIRLKSGQMVFARRVKGIPAKHWMQKSFEGARGAVNAAILGQLRTGIEAAIRESKT
jgi:hypothetical protein